MFLVGIPNIIFSVFDGGVRVKSSIQEMASSVPNVRNLLKQVSDGEEEALKHLGIHRGFQYECPPRFNPAKTSKKGLQQALNDTIFFAEVANKYFNCT